MLWRVNAEPLPPLPPTVAVQSERDLLDSYQAAIFIRCDETGKPDPNGMCFRLEEA